jgi:serine/threonine protein kinase
MKPPVTAEASSQTTESTAQKPAAPVLNGSPAALNRPLVPDYELLRRIGRGGYGEVWLARSKATGVLRAAKIVWRHTFEDERPFRREFEGIQKFEQISRDHPSQLALFHIGRNDAAGYFYYVMELADDATSIPEPEMGNPNASRQPNAEPAPQHEMPSTSESGRKSDFESPSSRAYAPRTLRSELQKGRLPVGQVMMIGLALTEALEHLHGKGLVHRDVKPSNVIFVHGRPKLADIGLVTDASDRCSIVGTEGYLPPEGPGTPHADLFALGKVLYEAATGCDRRQFPNLPADLRSWTDAATVFELNEIILKACGRDALGGYSSAKEMRTELDLIAKGKSVRRARQTTGLWRFGRRLAKWLIVATVALAVLTWVTRLHQPLKPSPSAKGTTNGIAAEQFNLGRIYMDDYASTNRNERAAECFKRAIQADTNFALAYAYLACVYAVSDDRWNPNWIHLPEAKEIALHALSLDQSLARPHLVLGWHKTLLEWKWSEAEEQYKRAIELDPDEPRCHSWYAEFLKIVGRANEAVAQQKIADSRADNKDPAIKSRLVAHLIAAHRFEEALKQSDFEVAMNPIRGGWHRSTLLCALGRYAEALDWDREVRLRNGERKEEVDRDTAVLKKAVDAEGPRAYWSKAWMKANGGLLLEAGAYAQLGDKDAAIRCLQKMLEEKDKVLTFHIMTFWELDPLRSDPRFHAILKTMHFE